MTLHHALAGLQVASARRTAPARRAAPAGCAAPAGRAAPDGASVFQAGIGALRRSGILDAALGAGQQAPDFELPDQDGRAVRLGTLLAGGPVVVTFCRGGWCPYCSLQLRAYQSMLPALTALGTRLVAVSPQALEPSREVALRNALHFDVLSDAGNRVARRYGLVLPLPPSWREAYAWRGIVLPRINGDADWTLPAPATFVVEPSGRIALSYLDVDDRNRLEPSEILGELRALRRPPDAGRDDLGAGPPGRGPHASPASGHGHG